MAQNNSKYSFPNFVKEISDLHGGVEAAVLELLLGDALELAEDLPLGQLGLEVRPDLVLGHLGGPREGRRSHETLRQQVWPRPRQAVQRRQETSTPGGRVGPNIRFY